MRTERTLPDWPLHSSPYSLQIGVEEQISRRRRSARNEWLGWIPVWNDPEEPDQWNLGSLRVLNTGNPTEVGIRPRDLYSEIFKLKADCYFLAHNHPSGSPYPSPADIVLTRKAHRLSNDLGVPLLGHLIVTRTTNHWIECDRTDMGPPP